jgi:hypothetical protein
MAKDYRISYFKDSDFKDMNGNTWCDVAFEGVSEPAKIVVKDPSRFSVGMEVYGELKEATTKNGKPYQRFYREKKEEHTQTSGSTYDSNGAKFGNALKIASDYYFAHGVSEMNEDDFVGAIQNLAGRIYGINIPEQAVATTETVKQTQGTTELQSLASTYGDTVAEVMDEPFSIGDIPF